MGNCVFVLITGYVMHRKSFNLQRIIKLWMEVWIYSVISGLVHFLYKPEAVSLELIIKVFMPVTFNEYWYMSTYVILYFLMPYINKMLENLNRAQIKYLIMVILGIFSVMPMVTNSNWIIGCNLAQFIMLYIIGGYIKEYNISGFILYPVPGSKVSFYIEPRKGFIISIGAVWMSEIVLKRYFSFLSFSYFAWPMYKTPIILLAVFMFLIFKDAHIKLPRYIIQCASSCFAVYLIHIGRMRELIFLKIFDNSKVYSNVVVLFGHILFAIISIFSISILIDKIRIIFVEKPVLRLADKKISILEQRVSRLFPK